MLRTGKQKFVCRRIVTYSNTHQTRSESYLEDRGMISFQNLERKSTYWIKDVLRNFYLQKRIHANFIVCIETNDQEAP